MTGAIDMGSAKVTTTYGPTNGADLTNKTYVDAILGSSTAAADSAAAAATSETNAATSETNPGNSASAAAASEANAAASYDDFDDRYLGAKASAPALDNDGDALIAGALYFNTTTDIMYVYGGSGWQAAGSSVNGTSERQTYTATSGQTTFAVTYDPGFVDVYLNGVKLISGTDFTATSGTSIVLTTGATAGDSVDIVAYGTFVVADTYTEAQADARFVNVTGDSMTGDLDITGKLGIGTSSPSEKLDVTGNITANANSSSTYARIRSSDTGVASLYFGNQSDAVTASISMRHDSGNALQFNGYNNAERMRINASGNVGIGKTNPATPLDVNGTVTATAFAGDGSSLTGIAAGAGGGGSDEIFWENGQNVTTDYTITNGKNAMSAGPITINSGVTVTVGAGETWTVI